MGSKDAASLHCVPDEVGAQAGRGRVSQVGPPFLDLFPRWVSAHLASLPATARKRIPQSIVLAKWTGTSIQDTTCLILSLIGGVSNSSFHSSLVWSEYLIPYIVSSQISHGIVKPSGGGSIVKDTVSSTTSCPFRNITIQLSSYHSTNRHAGHPCWLKTLKGVISVLCQDVPGHEHIRSWQNNTLHGLNCRNNHGLLCGVRKALLGGRHSILQVAHILRASKKSTCIFPQLSPMPSSPRFEHLQQELEQTTALEESLLKMELLQQKPGKWTTTEPHSQQPGTHGVGLLP